ncbi:alkaline phosphatase family protein [Streptomyces sp. NPDC056159]|uniref:alkaline phosphatase family protein n=1 Tax=Streptomyces sp. NPDC056159 TaxID=3155537 RepID=UPI0034397DF5
MGRSTRPRPPARRRLPAAAAGTTAALVLALMPSAASCAAPARQAAPHTLPGGYKHLVVIYEENHSFDNLYGTWGPVGGRQVEGLAQATARQRTQRAQDSTPYRCLLQNDVNLTSPPLPSTCRDAAHGVAASAFANGPFTVDDHIGPQDRTCPAPGVRADDGVVKDSSGALPGGCTRDLVHRFYQNRYAIDGGRQDRYVTASDAVGLTMGHYDTTSLPIHRYLHAPGAPRYVLTDHFFQGAFGGSFLNHQYLIAARAPQDTSGGASGAKNTVLDADGMPTSYPLYKATGPVTDGALTTACPDGDPADYAHACGNLAVNTVQPSSAPHGSGPRIPLIDDAKYPNIGDRLTTAGIPWNWYSGGWNDAEAGHPGPLFQYHHQPFAYFADYAPGTPGRGHLRDETEFLRAARTGTLPAVSFVKPYGAENEHPGYASEADGSDHLVDLLKTVTEGPQAGNTLVVVTYDEFGGQWDHLPPPGPGSPTRGAHDAWGPGTRIPALIISRSLPRSAVDHTVYDTTSIIATIERSYGLKPVATRDAVVNDLSPAVAAGGRGNP